MSLSAEESSFRRRSVNATVVMHRISPQMKLRDLRAQSRGELILGARSWQSVLS